MRSTDKKEKRLNPLLMGKGRKNTEIKVLTNNQEHFCQAFVRNGGIATDAYLECYNTESRQNAGTNGYQLLQNDFIKDRIYQLRELVNSSIQIDPKQYITSQLLAITEVSLFDFINSDGSIKELDNVSDSKKRALKDMTITEAFNPNTGVTTRTYKLSLMDRDKALDKLAKASGYYGAHQQSRYKSDLATNKAIRGTFGGGATKDVNIQNNYYNLSTEELEAKLKAIKAPTTTTKGDNTPI